MIPIYDPATRVFDGAGNVLQAPTAFPGNIIPANRIHPVSQKLLAYYPLPAQEVTGVNFVNNEARQVNADQITYRLDYSQGPSTWTFRHSYSREHGYDPFAIPDMGINTDSNVHQLVFSNTRTIGSNASTTRESASGTGRTGTSRRAPTPRTSSRTSASTYPRTIRSIGASRTST
jgi:hypothetical protein